MFIQRLMICFLSFLLCLPTSVASTTATGNAPPLSEELEKLDRLMLFAREIQAIISREAFDLEAVLEMQAYEAEQIIDFVKRSISFEAYEGVLRGSEGTLQSGAGNSLDQSILLASLLRDAGYSARIARTQLTDKNSLLVLGELSRPRVNPPPAGDPDSIADIMERYGMVRATTPEGRAMLIESIKKPIQPKSHEGYEQVSEVTKFITDQLEQGGVKLEESASQAELVSEASDYYWVEYQVDASGGWRAAHPTFAGAIPFEDPEPENVYVDSLPQELQHRLRFQVFIERTTGERREVIPIMDPWERPVANIVGLPLTFANIPDTLMQPPSGIVDLEMAARNATYYLPGFLGDTAPGASYFDLNGNLIDPMVAGSMASGIVKQVGQAFGDAIGTIGGGENVPTLTRQWLEFTLIQPGGEETAYRRNTLDLRENNFRSQERDSTTIKRADPSAARTLLQRHTFMVHTGRVSRGFALHDGASRLLSNEDSFRDTILLDRGQTPSKSVAESLSGDWVGHLSLFSYFDVADELGTQHRIYRSAPALVIHSDGLAPEAGYTSSIDIVSNPRRSIRIGEHGQPISDPALLVKAGVWETMLEGMVLPSGGERTSTKLAFEQAKGEDIPIRLVRTQEELMSLDVNDQTQAAIQADLDRGFVALVPSRISAESVAGWWRVNPITGETLGQIGDGRGSEIVKYLLLTASFGFFAYGTVQCAKDMAAGASTGANACCLGVTAGFFVMGIYFGAAVASANAAAAAAGSGAYISPAGAWIMYRIGASGGGWSLKRLCEGIVERI